MTTKTTTRKRRTKTNVHSLFCAAIPVAPVDTAVVAALENLLRLAKDGQIVGLMVGTVSPAKNIATLWEGAASGHDMVAASQILAARILDARAKD